MRCYVLKELLKGTRATASLLTLYAIAGCSALFDGDFSGLSRRTCGELDGFADCKSAKADSGARPGGDDGRLITISEPTDARAGHSGLSEQRSSDASLHSPMGSGSRPFQHEDAASSNRDDPRSPDASMMDAGTLPLPTGPLDDAAVPGATWVPSDVLATASIPVCFTIEPHREWDGTIACPGQIAGHDCAGASFSGTSEAQLRDELQALLRETWERAARLTFASFTVCDSATTTHIVESGDLSETVIVSFVGEGPTRATTGIGRRTIASDVHVNWHSLTGADPRGLREILREFGHVLGFRYEWLRKSQPPQGSCPVNLAPDPVAGTIPPPPVVSDPSSVMDRCSDPPDPSQLLSPGDFIGAQFVYRLKHDGAIVGTRAQCISVMQASTALGTPVIGASCVQEPSSRWFRTSVMPQSPRFEASLPGALRCLTARQDLDAGIGGLAIVSDQCTLADDQRFPTINLEWRAMGSMCIAAVGDHLELRGCDGSQAQQWNFFDGDPTTPMDWHQIQSSDGRCVSTRTDPTSWTKTTVVGEEVSLQSCDPADPRQLIYFLEGGFFGLGNPLLCLNVDGGQLSPGSHIAIADSCSDYNVSSSEFYVSGRLRVLGKCLNMSEKGVVTAAPCSDKSLEQLWDYH